VPLSVAVSISPSHPAAHTPPPPGLAVKALALGSVLGRTCVAPRWRRGWSRGGRGTLESAGGSLPRVCGHRTTCFAAPSRSTAPKNGRR